MKALLILGLLLLGCTPMPGAQPTPAEQEPSIAVMAAVPGTCSMRGPLPDSACTPGVANPAVTQDNIAGTICRSGWTATIRPPVGYTNELKRRQMLAYGLAGLPSDYEEDHLLSLELGGHPTDPGNLFPQAYAGSQGAHQKDAVENRLHREVCAGLRTLADAQHAIVTDWTAIP